MSFPGAPLTKIGDTDNWVQRIAMVVNSIMQGRTNNYGTVTLTANAASTTVNLAAGRLSTASVILLEPRTANASAEIGAGTIYITAANHDVANNRFVITHANNAQVDREYGLCIIG
jgi:hypothetical protein